MRVGVVILPQFSAVETRRRWKSLETRGFAHGWTYDHLAWRDLADEPWYSTVPTLATAAAPRRTFGWAPGSRPPTFGTRSPTPRI